MDDAVKRPLCVLDGTTITVDEDAPASARQWDVAAQLRAIGLDARPEGGAVSVTPGRAPGAYFELVAWAHREWARIANERLAAKAGCHAGATP